MLKYLHKLKSKKGFTMVELLISIGIFGVLILAMASLIRPVNRIIIETRRDARMDTAVDNIGHYIKKSTDVASRVEIFDWNTFNTGLGNAFTDAAEADAFLDNFSHCQRHSFEQDRCFTIPCDPTACFIDSHQPCVVCTCPPPVCVNALHCPDICEFHVPHVVTACPSPKEYQLFALFLDANGALYDLGSVGGKTLAVLRTDIVSAQILGNTPSRVFMPFYYNRCTVEYVFQTLPSGGLKIDINVVRNGDPVTRGRSTNYNYVAPFFDSVVLHGDVDDEIRNVPANGDPARGIVILYAKYDS